MIIPRVIHQTWRTADVRPEWRALVESWRRHHPGWEYRFWTDEDNQRLVDEHFPDLAAQYASCTHGVQRADISRCLIVYTHGGLYADLDVECLRPIEPLIDASSCVLTLEPSLHAAWMNSSQVVSNAVLAATPGHAFFSVVIELLRARNLRAARHVDVLTSTGPRLLGEALARHGATGVTVLPSERFSPLTSNSASLARLRHGHDADAIRAGCLESGAWGIHYWSNSWARDFAGALFNPQPDEIQGYVFQRGVDSPGHDLENGGRDIPKLAARCAADPRAAGFNTDGFLKATIRPHGEWVSMPHAESGEGLYLKRAFHFGGARLSNPSGQD